MKKINTLYIILMLWNGMDWTGGKVCHIGYIQHRKISRLVCDIRPSDPVWTIDLLLLNMWAGAILISYCGNPIKHDKCHGVTSLCS